MLVLETYQGKIEKHTRPDLRGLLWNLSMAQLSLITPNKAILLLHLESVVEFALLWYVLQVRSEGPIYNEKV